jgi:hypothetical protein
MGVNQPFLAGATYCRASINDNAKYRARLQVPAVGIRAGLSREFGSLSTPDWVTAHATSTSAAGTE